MNAIANQEIAQTTRQAVERHGADREALIPILNELNQAFGYIPREAFREIRQNIHDPENGLFLSDSQLYSIASFYKMFSLEPLGEHVIRFCESAPCHVMGGRQLIQAIRAELGIRPGETTPDQKWSLVMTSCLGLCSVGPVFFIDDELYGNISPELIPEILNRYR